MNKREPLHKFWTKTYIEKLTFYLRNDRKLKNLNDWRKNHNRTKKPVSFIKMVTIKGRNNISAKFFHTF